MSWTREPLLHFVGAGAAIFVLFQLVGGTEEFALRRIVVGPERVDHLVQSWRRTWQREPTPAELRGLVDDYVLEEILYREALAMGLDRDDTIVRRRLRQKMEFISEELTPEPEPGDDELARFLAGNPESFLLPPVVDFEHVYLNLDRRGAGAEEDAARLLETLLSGDADSSDLGDPLLLPNRFESAPADEIAARLGRDFVRALLEVEPCQWQGPIESGFGLHLVRVESRTPGRMPELAEVRHAVRREWGAAWRAEQKAAFEARLRESYEVVFEPGAAAASVGTHASVVSP